MVNLGTGYVKIHKRTITYLHKVNAKVLQDVSLPLLSISGSHPPPHQRTVHNQPAIYLRDGIQALQAFPQGEASFPHRIHGQRQEDATRVHQS